MQMSFTTIWIYDWRPLSVHSHVQSVSKVLHICESIKWALIINYMTQSLFGFSPLYYDLFLMSAHTYNVGSIGLHECECDSLLFKL